MNVKFICNQLQFILKAIWLCQFFKKMIVNALSLDYKVVEWRTHKMSIICGTVWPPYWKTLFSQDYGSHSMNIKQLLQLECIGLNSNISV